MTAPPPLSLGSAMPHSKDLRCGQGWFDVNINYFYDYLDEKNQELIVSDTPEVATHNSLFTTASAVQRQVKYRDEYLNQQIEERVNEFIQYKVFDWERNPLDEGDVLPSEYSDDIWGYVYYHITLLVYRKPNWYKLRDIQTQ